MIKNKIRQLWSEGKPALNGWLSVPNSFTAEIMAAQGYDSLTIDIQHGALDYSDALPMFQAMRASGVVPMARPSWLEPGIIMKALDAGAYGIICPMVNNAEDAARLVSYCRYPPKGQRSFGPTRALYAAGGNYAAEANDEILVLAMIETADGIRNVKEICATPGIDGVYIGPSDLTLAVAEGRLRSGLDREEPEMIEVIHAIRDAAKEAGIRACLHTGHADYAARGIEWGFDLVTVHSDAGLLADAARASVERFRDLTGTELAPVNKREGY